MQNCLRYLLHWGLCEASGQRGDAKCQKIRDCPWEAMLECWGHGQILGAKVTYSKKQMPPVRDFSHCNDGIPHRSSEGKRRLFCLRVSEGFQNVYSDGEGMVARTLSESWKLNLSHLDRCRKQRELR